jgi:hypothetical protein
MQKGAEKQDLPAPFPGQRNPERRERRFQAKRYMALLIIRIEK